MEFKTRSLTKRITNPLPSNYIIFGIVGTVFALSFLITGRYISFGILQFVARGLLTARDGIIIDTKANTIKNLRSVFFIEWGEVVNYKQLQGLFLKSGLYSQGMNTRGSSHSIKYTLYTVTVYADDIEYILKSSKNEGRMVSYMNDLSSEMGIPVLE